MSPKKRFFFWKREGNNAYYNLSFIEASRGLFIAASPAAVPAATQPKLPVSRTAKLLWHPPADTQTPRVASTPLIRPLFLFFLFLELLVCFPVFIFHVKLKYYFFFFPEAVVGYRKYDSIK